MFHLKGYTTVIYGVIATNKIVYSGLASWSMDSKHQQLFVQLITDKTTCMYLNKQLNDFSVPNYFNKIETPIICYKYNKPMRSTIFNINKIVTNMDIDSNTPDSFYLSISLQSMLLPVI